METSFCGHEPIRRWSSPGTHPKRPQASKTHGGFLKWGYPKMNGLYGKIPLEQMVWRYPHFRTPPCKLLKIQRRKSSQLFDFKCGNWTSLNYMVFPSWENHALGDFPASHVGLPVSHGYLMNIPVISHGIPLNPTKAHEIILNHPISPGNPRF